MGLNVWYIWHTLQLRGVQVPRFVVQELMQYLDPEGCELRRVHRLRRRVYTQCRAKCDLNLNRLRQIETIRFPDTRLYRWIVEESLVACSDTLQ